MQDYQKFGIQNHPAISAEYVRFLVSHSAQGAISRFEKELTDLKKKYEEINSIAKAAQSSANTATNKAKEAKDLAQKK